MTCQQFVAFLMAYLDGELPAQERALFEEHMTVCPDCVRYIDQYRETIRAAQRSIDDDLPADVPEELVRAVLGAKASSQS